MIRFDLLKFRKHIFIYLLISILIILIISWGDIGKKLNYPFLSIGCLMMITYELEVEDKKLIEPLLATPMSPQRFVLRRITLLSSIFLLSYIILGGVYYLLENVFSVRYLLLGVLASCLPSLRKRILVPIIVILLIILNTTHFFFICLYIVFMLFLVWRDLKNLNKEEMVEKKEWY